MSVESAHAVHDPQAAYAPEAWQPEEIQSQANDRGGELDPAKLEDQATALGVDYDKEIEFLKQDVPDYGGDDEKKANFALLTQLQLKASNFEEVAKTKSPEEVAQYTADLKNAGIAGDGQKVRDLITENGGDVSALENDQLAHLYGVNTHLGNHHYFANEASPSGVNYFTASHAFETNYASEDGYEQDGQLLGGNGTPQNTLGFHDDTGAHWQRTSEGEVSLEGIVDEVAKSHDVFLARN